MQILILSREYSPDEIGGGIGSHLAGFAPALVARGHEVHVVSCAPGRPRRDVVQDGVFVHRRPALRLRGLARVLGSPSGALRLRIALSCVLEVRRLRLRPDVIHMPDWMAEGLFFALRGRIPTAASLATPLHMTVEHNGRVLDWDTKLGDRLERIAVRRASAVSSTSQLLAGELAEWLGGREVRIIPPPVDAGAWASSAPVDDTGPVLLAVGRIEHRKAPDIVVEAAGRLPAELGAEVVFVGRGEGERAGLPYEEWLARRADELGVRCTFAGQVGRDDLLPWYGRARVVVVPSRFDSFAVTALEGMACGRPVVCSATTGASELLGDHGDLVVPTEDAPALAAAVEPFLRDAGMAARTGAELRSIVIGECSPERTAERREALYLDAIERHRSGGRHLRSA